MASNCLGQLKAAFSESALQGAGSRVSDLSALRNAVAASGAVGSVAAHILGPRATPVRAIYFDKSDASNWALGWHQDRTIAVKNREAVAGFGPWTVKGGLWHVAPPVQLLEGMLTLRVHLDDVDEQNAPLLVAPGSHRYGRIPEREIDEVVARCGTYACLAEAGDVWVYSTLILHASERARTARRRRVIQIDYAAAKLPAPLEWTDLLAGA